MPAVLIFDPEQVPVVGTDAHLPPVPAQRLSPHAVRARFATPPVWAPEFTGDGRLLERPRRDAAVLVPLVQRPPEQGGLRVLLTRRNEQMRDHAGQVAFPGGRREDTDRDVIATALRECEEEIGLAASTIDVVGCLPTYTTVTAFVVTPVVALLPPDLPLAPDPYEVAEVFEVPLSHLMNPAMHRRHRFELDAQRREFLSMPWEEGGQRYFIWGATAAMLRNLYRFLSA